MTVTEATPDWLTRGQVGLCPCGCIGKRQRSDFIDKTLAGGSRLMRQALFSEESALRPGLLQSIEPRLKLVGLFGLLLSSALLHHVEVVLVVYVAALALAWCSSIGMGFFIKRVWLFIPVFTGIVVLPATFSFVTSGHIVVPLGQWFGHRVGLTSQGLNSAALIVSRVATSISLVVLMTLTTPWSKVLSALRGLRVPKIFIMVLGMAYRYVFHLLGSVDDMYTARRARTVHRDSEVTSGRAFVAATAGATFGKAHALSTEVYMAMVSRGYTGEAHSSDRFVVRGADIAWIVGCVLLAVVTLGVDRGIL